MDVLYLVVAPGTRQDEVIKLFMETFPDSTKSIARCRFPLDKIYCYITVSKYLEYVDLTIKGYLKEDGRIVDSQLTIYQDMVAIPLMNVAMAESKDFKDA